MRGWTPFAARALRRFGPGVGRPISVVLAVLAGIGGKNIGPLLSSNERPPVPRPPYRP